MARRRRDCRRRVALIHEHQATDQSVDRPAVKLDLAKVPTHELDVADPGLDRAATCGRAWRK